MRRQTVDSGAALTALVAACLDCSHTAHTLEQPRAVLWLGWAGSLSGNLGVRWWGFLGGVNKHVGSGPYPLALLGGTLYIRNDTWALGREAAAERLQVLGPYRGAP